eukprot:jgi/Mesen1/3296/ME000191S02430
MAMHLEVPSVRGQAGPGTSCATSPGCLPAVQLSSLSTAGSARAGRAARAACTAARWRRQRACLCCGACQPWKQLSCWHASTARRTWRSCGP